MQLTEAFALPSGPVEGTVTVVEAEAGTVADPPLRLSDLDASGGTEPGGSVIVSVQGLAVSGPPAAIVTVKFAVPPSGTVAGETSRPARDVIRKPVEPVAPLQVAE